MCSAGLQVSPMSEANCVAGQNKVQKHKMHETKERNKETAQPENTERCADSLGFGVSQWNKDGRLLQAMDASHPNH